MGNSFYKDVLPAIDAMPDSAPETKRAVLKEAQQNAVENPISKEDTLKKVVKQKKEPNNKEIDNLENSKTGRRKLKVYRKAILSGYKHLLALGIKESVIARIFGLDERFANIKQNGDKGIKRAYEEAMAELEAALTANMLKQAIGYDYVEVKTTYEPRKTKDTVFKGIKLSGPLVTTKVEKTQKHYPGKPQLFLAYMATHFPEKWKIKGADGAGGVHFHITGEVLTDQLDKIAGKYLTKPVESNVIENEVDQNNDG